MPSNLHKFTQIGNYRLRSGPQHGFQVGNLIPFPIMPVCDPALKIQGETQAGGPRLLPHILVDCGYFFLCNFNKSATSGPVHMCRDCF